MGADKAGGLNRRQGGIHEHGEPGRLVPADGKDGVGDQGDEERPPGIGSDDARTGPGATNGDKDDDAEREEQDADRAEIGVQPDEVLEPRLAATRVPGQAGGGAEPPGNGGTEEQVPPAAGERGDEHDASDSLEIAVTGVKEGKDTDGKRGEGGGFLVEQSDTEGETGEERPVGQQGGDSGEGGQ